MWYKIGHGLGSSRSYMPCLWREDLLQDKAFHQENRSL